MSGIPRLMRCNRLLAERGPFVGTCPRCKTVYEPPAAPADEGMLLTRQMVASLAAILDREPQASVIHNHMPTQPAPVTNVNIPPTEVTVNTPAVTVSPTPVEVRNEVTIEPTPIEIHPTEVQIDVSPTPVEVRNEVTVSPTPVEVRNQIDISPTPIEVTTGDVHVRAEMPANLTMDITSMPPQSMDITSMPAALRRVTKRDTQGRILEVSEEPE
jgi:hypothetical protein